MQLLHELDLAHLGLHSVPLKLGLRLTLLNRHLRVAVHLYPDLRQVSLQLLEPIRAQLVQAGGLINDLSAALRHCLRE